ncbi:hypothetical protein D3C75_1159760 [compost metagenome]
MPPQIQQQLEAPLQRECASVGRAATVVGEGGESGTHAESPDAVEEAGWGKAWSECVVVMVLPPGTGIDCPDTQDCTTG